ncbi:porin [Variovorax paradoxus]|uniref:porin n=1 Tax=Variovorax paradoxus TaxID=34073 RepID=UPI0021AD0517|nr:porin [Variovorax paradoxus]UVH60575.1 porin [Variovorax paradoxus]
MKKTLVAMTTLAVTGVASAQSSITMFGLIDTGITRASNRAEDLNGPTLRDPFYVNRGSVTTSRTELRHSSYHSSRFGFRGTEDLGGGLAASFWLESPISNDDGQQGLSTFARRSTISLSGGFGELRLGRDYTPSFWNETVFDPFGTNGVGTNLIHVAFNGSFAAFGPAATPVPGITNVKGNSAVRNSNSIGYFLPPNIGGFYGQVMYAFHENTKYSPGTATPPGVAANGALNPGAVATTQAGRYIGGRFGYLNGPLDVAVGYGNTTVGDSYYQGTTSYLKVASLGASYDFGPVKLFGEVARSKRETKYDVAPIGGGVPDVDLDGYLVGATVPVGPGLIRVAYSHVKYDYNAPGTSAANPKSSKLALGYVHNLSKRTALYASIARVSNKNGANLTVAGPDFYNTPAGVFTPKTSTGYDVGIRHAF